jgi:hypothetical protein
LAGATESSAKNRGGKSQLYFGCSLKNEQATKKGKSPMNDKLVLPSQIPWEEIKGKDLEELLYWLFDSMGARDLEWRIGGKGSGASDQGRDLELSFHVSSPDGDLVKQKWWIEAKGRSGVVEPTEVKSAVINAAGKTDVDVLVIATNRAFSNPTRDWVKDWQRDHARPKVKLWERTELENLCSKNPIAVIRLFGKALSPQGRLEVTKTKLWDYASYTDEPTLIDLWRARNELTIDAPSLIALVSSEIANGDINARSWAMFVDEQTVLDSLGDGLVNCLYLVFRVNDSGVRQEPLIGGLAHLVLVCDDRLGATATSKLLSVVWEQKGYPEQIRKAVLHPVLQLLLTQIRDVCTSDCRRVSTDRILLSEKEVTKYWNQLFLTTEEMESKERLIVSIESPKIPCKVGFRLSKKRSCPLCHNDAPEDNILQTLKTIKTVADFRKSNR